MIDSYKLDIQDQTFFDEIVKSQTFPTEFCYLAFIDRICKACIVDLNFNTEMSDDIHYVFDHIVRISDEYFNIRIKTKTPLKLGEPITINVIESYSVNKIQPYLKVGWCQEDNFYSQQQRAIDFATLNEVKNIDERFLTMSDL